MSPVECQMQVFVPADPQAIPDARSLARRWALTALGEERASELVLAFGEAITNAVLHGCPIGGSQPIEVTLFRTREWVGFSIQDPGPGFDVEAVPIPDPLTGDPSETGYGILTIRNLVDATWINGGSCVVLRARVAEHVAPPASDYRVVPSGSLAGQSRPVSAGTAARAG